MNETNNPIPTMPTPPGTYSAAAAEMKTILFCAAACAALFSAAAEPEGAAADAEFPPESVAEADGAEDAPKNDPLNAVVKLEVSKAEIDVLQPWRTDRRQADGSGAVIGDGRILTCAHCVSDATFIRVRKPNEDAIYHATVEFVGNDSDLALVRVEDPTFMSGVTPMEIGETPSAQAQVVAIGYPKGGRLVSFTRGIVSRIEDQTYSHSYKSLLAVQVDAAINPGNSGGPVLDLEAGRIAGIAFQGDKDGEALGYMIPPDVIRQFLADVADGRVDGVGEPRFSFLSMESESKRRAYGMKPGQTGVSVTHTDPSLGDGSVRAGDVLLEVGGYRVANNGNIRIEGNEIRSIHWPVYIRQLGETVPARVLRDGAETEVSIPVSKRNWRIRPFLHDRRPDWFLVGGLAFTTISFDWLAAGRSHYRENPGDEQKTPGEELVVLCSTFPDASIEGYLGWARCRVDTVNGTKVLNLRHLAELVDGCTDEFLRFGMDDNDEWNIDLVVDTAQMREATRRVMERYAIPADRSEDLRRD